MTRKVLFVSLLSLLASSVLVLPTASSATPITDFDGIYNGTVTITGTLTINSTPPKKIVTTNTNVLSLVVKNGKIIGGATGSILDVNGNATMVIPFPGYGDITLKAHFVRNASSKVLTSTGTLSASFPGYGMVFSGKFSLTGGDKFSFTIPSTLKNAQIGKKYPDYSFCQPPVPSGGLCGTFPKSTNPSGGKAPYSFRLKVGSDFLPTGMILNFRTGQISGTPIAGQKPVTKKLIVCAYDSNDAFTGVCRTTTMVLTR